jgi:hypothetical protein
MTSKGIVLKRLARDLSLRRHFDRLKVQDVDLVKAEKLKKANYYHNKMETHNNTTEYHRALCSVVLVRTLSPIAGADKIELAEVNGWQCVISKDEGMKEGDLALYFSIDSIPDLDDPNCALVKKRGGRIKTIKLRGIISQGLLAPLSWMSSRGHDISELTAGDDVTGQMGVTKVLLRYFLMYSF